MSVLCLGEILVDCVGDRQLPGGAPANVACHVAALGGKAQLVSGLGDDETGRHLAAWLRERGVFAGLLQTVTGLPTGTVQVSAGPRYEIAAPAAWDHVAVTEAARSAAACAGVAVFGTLAQRHPVSRRTIRALVEAARAARVPVLCDLNLRAPFYDEETVLWSLRHCDVLKLNRGELDAVSRLLAARGSTVELFAGILREFAVPRGVLTDGENGAWFSEDGRVWHQPAESSGTFSDAVGAGDACSAVLALAMARSVPLGKAAAPAAALAAFVVSQPGATPEVPAPLCARLNAMLCA